MEPSEIKVLRNRMGLTQREFARALGVSQPTVWKWETGKSRPQETHVEIMRFWREQLDEEQAEELIQNLLAAGGALSLSVLLDALVNRDEDD